MNLGSLKKLLSRPIICFGEYELKKQNAATSTKEDKGMPPVFSKSFYKLLTEGSEEFGVTRAEFAIRALRHYLKELRLRKSPVTEVAGEDSAKQYAKVQSKLAKNYWSNVSVEERKARLKKALDARWSKKT